MTFSPEGLVPAPHVRTVRTDRSVVLVNYLDGTVTLLTGDAELAWLTCLDGAAHLSDDTRVLDWIRQRWLIPGHTDATTSRTVWASDPTTSWGTQEVLAYLPAPAPSPWRWRLAALPALAMVLAVQHFGHRARRFHRLVRLCRLGTRLPPASSQPAHDAIRAVRWAARLIPARVACLEESVTAVLLLAAAGHRARWRHGIATDPLRLHAWIVDDNDRPVDEPMETQLYTTITEIPDPRMKDIRP